MFGIGKAGDEHAFGPQGRRLLVQNVGRWRRGRSIMLLKIRNWRLADRQEMAVSGPSAFERLERPKRTFRQRGCQPLHSTPCGHCRISAAHAHAFCITLSRAAALGLHRRIRPYRRRGRNVRRPHAICPF